MKTDNLLLRENSRIARKMWGIQISRLHLLALKSLTHRHRFSIGSGDLIFLRNGWYATHAGLIRLGRRSRCAGIDVEPATGVSEPADAGCVLLGLVYKSSTCKGFTAS